MKNAAGYHPGTVTPSTTDGAPLHDLYLQDEASMNEPGWLQDGQVGPAKLDQSVVM